MTDTKKLPTCLDEIPRPKIEEECSECGATFNYHNDDLIPRSDVQRLVCREIIDLEDNYKESSYSAPIKNTLKRLGNVTQEMIEEYKQKEARGK